MAIHGILTRPKFVTWLQKQKPSTPVGVPLDEHACPLATFLGACGVEAYVDGDAITTGPLAEDIYRTLKWAQRFIAKVDDQPAAIRAEQALAFLGVKPKKKPRKKTRR